MYPFEGQDWNDKKQNTIINSTGLHNVVTVRYDRE